MDDPTARCPTLWFQETEPHETPRQRFHLDIWVPHDVARARIAAALEAGGTLVSDTEAPSFTVLADADGNKACVCTWQAPGLTACNDVGSPYQHLGRLRDWLDAGTPRRRT